MPVLSTGIGLARGPVNMIVTNVPGPQFPLYSVGARLLGMYPKVPLLPGSGLGIALFSYEGKLCWGFNADYRLVPDLHDFVADLRTSFEELRRATVAQYMERRTAAPETAPERFAVVRAEVADGPLGLGHRPLLASYVPAKACRYWPGRQRTGQS